MQQFRSCSAKSSAHVESEDEGGHAGDLGDGALRSSFDQETDYLRRRLEAGGRPTAADVEQAVLALQGDVDRAWAARTAFDGRKLRAGLGVLQSAAVAAGLLKLATSIDLFVDLISTHGVENDDLLQIVLLLIFVLRVSTSDEWGERRIEAALARLRIASSRPTARVDA